jgi:serine/threonine-protein kinase
MLAPPDASQFGDFDPPQVKRRSPLLPVAAVGLVLAAGAAVFFTQNKPASHRPPVAVEPAPAPVAAPAAAAPPVPADEPKLPPSPAKVTVRVVSRPSGAELWLADEPSPRGTTPLDLVLRRDSAELHGVLKAEGYADAKLEIDPGRKGPLEVALERVKSPPHHHATAHHPAHADESPAKPVATPKKPADGFFGVGD